MNGMISRYLLRLYQTHSCPSLQKNRFDLLHPFPADAVVQLVQDTGFTDLTFFKYLKPEEEQPLGILMKLFHPPLIGIVVTVLQDMNLDYQSEAFPIFAYRGYSRTKVRRVNDPKRSKKRPEKFHGSDLDNLQAFNQHGNWVPISEIDIANACITKFHSWSKSNILYLYGLQATFFRMNELEHGQNRYYHG
jgi:hypothetical protein